MSVETLRAKASFSFDDKHGVPCSVREGDVMPSNHPAVKGRRELFEPVDEVAERSRSQATYAAETATAGPGERRVLTHGQ